MADMEFQEQPISVELGPCASFRLLPKYGMGDEEFGSI